MAMEAQGLANMIKAKTQDITSPEAANNALWEAICEYVESNAEVLYQWSAVDSSGMSDPTVSWIGKIKTSGNLVPCGCNTPEEALSSVSRSMNNNVNAWTIIPAPGFSTSGPTISNSSIELKKSMASNRDAALLSIATDIVAGIQAAIPPTHSGAHGSYTGATTSGKIL